MIESLQSLLFPHANMNHFFQLKRVFQVLVLGLFVLSGCQKPSTSERYENNEIGISLEKPGNWSISFNDRNGILLLYTGDSRHGKDSARIEFFSPACPSSLAAYDDPYEAIATNVERIKRLYNLQSIDIIQGTSIVKKGNIEIVKAAIVVPTMALVDDPNRNQTGVQKPNIFQNIEIYALTKNNDILMAFVYQGNNEAINSQAQDIVVNTEITCSSTMK